MGNLVKTAGRGLARVFDPLDFAGVNKSRSSDADEPEVLNRKIRRTVRDNAAGTVQERQGKASALLAGTAVDQAAFRRLAKRDSAIKTLGG